MMSFGYVYLPAVIGVSITSIFSAKYGADICPLFISKSIKKFNGNLVLYCFSLYVFNMIIELSDFFNNPSLIALGPLSIQYYAITWLLSALLIYLFLKQHKIIKRNWAF